MNTSTPSMREGWFDAGDGNRGELLFRYECSVRGIPCFTPTIDNNPDFDAVVGYRENFKAVQIKTTCRRKTKKGQADSWQFQLGKSAGGFRRNYDVLALYTPDPGIWWFIDDIGHLPDNAINITKHGMWKSYEDRWDILTMEEQSGLTQFHLKHKPADCTDVGNETNV